MLNSFLAPAARRLRRAARYCLVHGYYGATVLVELLGRALRRLGLPRVRRIAPAPFAPGISIIIPERANAGLLARCLTAACTAARRSAEPWEIVVVVNGSPRHEYGELESDFPFARFLYRDAALGFSGAIEEGLKHARHDWVYLLNNDMMLEPAALEEIAKWRAPHVFAVASQIFFADRSRRREETGWTDFEVRDGWVTIFDVPPEDDALVRGNFYAGGGASLFRKQLLSKFLDSRAYAPFYWEDVEWGTLAWCCGFENLFCPQSRAWHEHRATVSKFHTPLQIAHLFRRNNYRYQMRNLFEPRLNRNLFRWLLTVDRDTFYTLLGPGEVWRTLRARWRRFSLPVPAASLSGRRRRYYPRPFDGPDSRPWLVAVAPFAVYPPLHGGAVRVHMLLESLAERFHVVLLSDEAALYGPRSWKYTTALSGLHLVDGRREQAVSTDIRIARIQSHCHPGLRLEFARLLECHRPASVQIEHMELAGLIDLRPVAPQAAWVLILHDVLLSGNGRRSREDIFEDSLIRRFDAAAVCSAEDAALLPGRARLVLNGVDYRPDAYSSSRGSNVVLFPGPFRYPPNLEGIVLFAERVFPALRQAVPGVELWVLGGDGAPARAAGIAALQAPGIRVFDAIEDVRPMLRQCALTINPVAGCRGSSIKLMGSMAAGRVCVSTTDGARGFLDAGFSALVVVPSVEDMLTPLRSLLENEDHRVRLESENLPAIEQFDWRHRGRELIELHDSLIAADRKL